METSVAQTERANILDLEQFISDLPGEKISQTEGLTHHFAPGCYGRELFLPAGSMVVGKIHKHSHITVLLAGTCSFSTEHSKDVLVGPAVLVSKAGEKRAVYAHTDARWLTIHPTQETELEKIEDEVIASSFEALDNFLELQNKSFPRRLIVHGKQFFRRLKSDQVSLEIIK